MVEGEVKVDYILLIFVNPHQRIFFPLVFRECRRKGRRGREREREPAIKVPALDWELNPRLFG